MDWVKDTATRWVRTMMAEGDGLTPIDEAVRLVAELTEPPVRPKRFGRRRAAQEPGPAANTAFSRYVIFSVLASDLLLTRLQAATGESREEVLADLTSGLEQWMSTERLESARLELSAMANPHPAAYGGLGERIEHLLELAEQQATELVRAARTEAAELRRCPGCGTTH